ncbi:MAG: D-TA family PLP-dependent enzyme [Paracoccaceae bacterium]
MLPRIETPAVLIDTDIALRNIAAAQARFDAAGVTLRPHIKTHKLVRFAQEQIAAGAVGITCQKTTEAEPFARAGIGDILITYNIIGAEKLTRLRSLAQMARVSVVADNPVVVQGLAAAFADVPVPLRVLVECDTGLHRCGVATPDDAVALARRIAESPGLQFGGLMTYPAPGSHAAVEAFMTQARAGCMAVIGHCETISSGGTPSMADFPAQSIVTEYRPGTYIYNDRSLLVRGACTLADCALVVLTTVVSRPSENRAILDAGSKVLSSDLLGMTGYGLLRDYPQAVITGLSEEHGHVDLSACARKPNVGEVVAVVPNHACVVSNLFDFVHLAGAGGIEKVAVDARGMVL